MLPLVAEWTRGEGTQSEIAARHGMPAPTFSWWCLRLARQASSSGRFVAVEVEPEEMGGGDGAFEVVLSRGRSVRVPSRFDAAALSRLLGVLEPPC